jgi:phosphohistidine phosphatase SixA
MIASLNNKYNNILIIGHNPTISNAANYITGENEIFLQPSNIVIIDLYINKWEEISHNTGKKIELI